MRVDVRVIAATRRDLDKRVQDGDFREDLFFRLAVGRVELPPLRRRRGDVTFLARHFWKTLGGDPPGLIEEMVADLEKYSWPGNVRELHNAILRRISLGELALGSGAGTRPTQESSDADAIAETLALGLPFPRARDRVLEVFERCYVEHALERHGGNVARAAASSGIARRYVHTLRTRSR